MMVRLFAIGLVLLLVSMVLAVAVGGSKMSEYEDQCKEAGGVPVRTSNQMICLTPEALIRP
jgi:hypothetical protein